jgi:hypothetical protein
VSGILVDKQSIIGNGGDRKLFAERIKECGFDSFEGVVELVHVREINRV